MSCGISTPCPKCGDLVRVESEPFRFKREWTQRDLCDKCKLNPEVDKLLQRFKSKLKGNNN